MSTDFITPPPPSSKKTKQDRLDPKPGTLTHLIGTGENAQFSIVYKTISWCFLAASTASAILIGYTMYKGESGILESLKGVWAIFIPVITLSLGYIFGKTK